jgi:hypothetical protein
MSTGRNYPIQDYSEPNSKNIKDIHEKFFELTFLSHFILGVNRTKQERSPLYPELSKAFKMLSANLLIPISFPDMNNFHSADH